MSFLLNISREFVFHRSDEIWLTIDIESRHGQDFGHPDCIWLGIGVTWQGYTHCVIGYSLKEPFSRLMCLFVEQNISQIQSNPTCNLGKFPRVVGNNRSNREHWVDTGDNLRYIAHVSTPTRHRGCITSIRRFEVKRLRVVFIKQSQRVVCDHVVVVIFVPFYLKLKRSESSRREKKNPAKSSRETYRGADSAPPPPRAFLG